MNFRILLPYPAGRILFQDGSLSIKKQEYIFLLFMAGANFLQGVNSLIFDFQDIIVKNQMKIRLKQNNMVYNLIIINKIC